MQKAWYRTRYPYVATLHPRLSEYQCSTPDGLSIAMGRWKTACGVRASLCQTGPIPVLMVLIPSKGLSYHHLVVIGHHLAITHKVLVQLIQKENPIFLFLSLVMFCRTTRMCVPFASESQYVVPTSGKDALPLAAEGPRCPSNNWQHFSNNN